MQKSQQPAPRPENRRWGTAAVIGAGTIGLGWAALFASHGITVRLTDPRPDLEQSLDETLPLLAASLSTSTAALRGRIRIADGVADAVGDAGIVQENGPERLEFKRELFAEIAEHAPGDAVLASSSSGIVATDIAGRLPDEVAARLLVAHPFNPPQVVPLVEVVPGERTAGHTVDTAMDFYRALGKTPVRLHKELPGFAANRLQSAVLQEAFHLVLEGVLDAAELDTVMRASLGERWAVVGPFESYHLGGGPGGIRHMFAHLGAGTAEKWKELGHPAMTDDDIALLTEQTEAAYGTGPDAYRERAGRRDRKQLAVDAAVTD